MSKLAHSCEATMAIIATQNCGECNGRGAVNICGADMPCPLCRPDEHAEVLEALGSGGMK